MGPSHRGFVVDGNDVCGVWLYLEMVPSSLMKAEYARC
jgi:hypothetical protein